MKKLMTLAALVAACAPAFTAEVESSNTVGYTKVNLSAGLNMIGVQFLDVGQNDAAVSTFGVLDSGLQGFDADSGNYFSTMMVWNGNGYTTYGWAGTTPSSISSEYAELDNTWLTGGGEATDDAHSNGYGFWIDAEKAGTITLKGEVPVNATPVQLAAGLNIIANQYPVEVPVSTFGVLDSGLKGFDADSGNYFSTMMVWNGNGYTTYGWAGTTPSSISSEYAELDNTWLTGGGEPTDATIPAGHAVWIDAEKAGTITFTAPAPTPAP